MTSKKTDKIDKFIEVLTTGFIWVIAVTAGFLIGSWIVQFVVNDLLHPHFQGITVIDFNQAMILNIAIMLLRFHYIPVTKDSK